MKPIREAWQALKEAGKIPEEQKNPDFHDLLTLYHAIPADVRKAAGFAKHERWLERYRNVFTKSRHEYELDAKRGHDSILTDIGGELVDSVAEYAKQAGSADLWILAYPNV
ncbi:hypothetical protein D9M68_666270 [compost metagenome]